MRETMRSRRQMVALNQQSIGAVQGGIQKGKTMKGRRGKLGVAIAAVCVAVTVLLSVGIAAAQSWQLQPSFGTMRLNWGFMPDPRNVNLVAGGPVRTQHGGCSAYVAQNPSVRLHYAAGRHPLYISAMSGADTTLLVNLPNGQWMCNDDTNGFNPVIHLPRPLAGQYDIFVGTYNGGTAPATLSVSELPPGAPQPAPRPQPRPVAPQYRPAAPAPQYHPAPAPAAGGLRTTLTHCQQVGVVTAVMRVTCNVINTGNVPRQAQVSASVTRTSNSAVLNRRQNITLGPGARQNVSFNFREITARDQGIRCQCEAF